MGRRVGAGAGNGRPAPVAPVRLLLAEFPALYADIVRMVPHEHDLPVSRKRLKSGRFRRKGRVRLAGRLIGFAAGTGGIDCPDLEPVGPVIRKAGDRVAPCSGSAPRHVRPIGIRTGAQLPGILPMRNRRVARARPPQAHLGVAVFGRESGRLWRCGLCAGTVRRYGRSANQQDRDGQPAAASRYCRPPRFRKRSRRAGRLGKQAQVPLACRSMAASSARPLPRKGFRRRGEIM